MRPHASAIAALLLAAASATSLAAAERLPRAFHGDWAPELDQCKRDGEHSVYSIDGRVIAGYEHGWTIRRWRRSGQEWIGTGTQDDDQGSMPGRLRLKLAGKDRLLFDGAARVRCPARDRRAR
jgi:hypothetical protein